MALARVEKKATDELADAKREMKRQVTQMNGL